MQEYCAQYLENFFKDLSILNTIYEPYFIMKQVVKKLNLITKNGNQSCEIHRHKKHAVTIPKLPGQFGTSQKYPKMRIVSEFGLYQTLLEKRTKYTQEFREQLEIFCFGIEQQKIIELQIEIRKQNQIIKQENIFQLNDEQKQQIQLKLENFEKQKSITDDIKIQLEFIQFNYVEQIKQEEELFSLNEIKSYLSKFSQFDHLSQNLELLITNQDLYQKLTMIISKHKQAYKNADDQFIENFCTEFY
ncbi:hypothetical protein ABPG72_018542 [Tetrahymena utriculariae]